ncbi:hypothetical protein [Novosphingobium taihuense]|uniref:Uncharacterized protein n=1 Tax=Novosphingobium taihuense TaxID=260085 RepID=A0A7W7A909_9SPHN|nr:hypothetical protein [Novosphingobium taihuense]MBB4612654.1 hypothetical protein [Novosphingobium taihuense]TWH87996.1 hypothetical protein IQ25_00110 [Novosphingobium taihuense]
MSDPQTLKAARALRDDALAVFKGDLDMAKLEVSPSRVKERALGEAVEMIDTARAIAGENKAVIGATLTALLAWFLREPLQQLVKRGADLVRPGD